MSDYAAMLKDAILDRSALTEDLVDDEAKVLIDWAMHQVERVAALMQTEADMETKGEVFMDMLKNFSRLVARRFDKDEAWFSEKLIELNTLSASIDGPTTTPDQQAALLNHAEISNLDLLQALLNAYSPAVPVAEDEVELHKDTEPDLEAVLKASTPDSTEEVEVGLSPHALEPYEEPPTNVVNYTPLADEIETYRPPVTDIQPYEDEE